MTNTNQERYQAAFSNVHAPADAVQKALEKLPAEPVRRRRKPLRAAFVTAAVLACMTLAVHAEISSGEISNLLAPLYGGSRSELIGKIGHPVDASASAGGYTITADAIIGDRYNLCIVYTLSKDDGTPFEETPILNWHSDYLRNGGSALEFRDDDPTDNKIQILESTSTSDRLPLGRIVTVSFSDSNDGSGNVWTLRFALRYKDTSVHIPVKDLAVTGSDGGLYEIKKVTLSSVGLHVDMTAPVPDDGQRVSPDFSTALVLSSDENVSGETSLTQTDDGFYLPLHLASAGGGWTLGDERIKRADYTVCFPVPIPLETITAIELCGTRIPLSDAGQAGSENRPENSPAVQG